jgi:hypothetical protein
MIWHRLGPRHWVGRVEDAPDSADYVILGHIHGWVVVAPNGDLYPAQTCPDFEAAVSLVEDHAADAAPAAPLQL